MRLLGFCQGKRDPICCKVSVICEKRANELHLFYLNFEARLQLIVYQYLTGQTTKAKKTTCKS